MSVMPLVLVGANVKGKPDYMAAGAVTAVCKLPPMVSVAISRERYMTRGIDENKTFSLNIPSTSQVVEADHCGLVSGAKEDKSRVFQSFCGKPGTAPLALECPVNIECTLFKKVECGSHSLYIGEVAEVHADKTCLTNGTPDITKIFPIMYTQMSYFGVGNQIEKAFS